MAQQFMDDIYSSQKEEKTNLNMTAQEARDRVNAKLTSDTNSQFSKIMSEINKAVSAGKLECWIYDSEIKDAVRQKLTTLGYSVGLTNSDRDGSLTNIGW